MRGVLGRLRVPVVLAFVFLAASPLLATSFAVTDSLAVSCDPSRSIWKCDLEVDGHPAIQTDFDVNNCLAPRPVSVKPYGAAVVSDFGSSRCGAPLHLASYASAGTLTTVARSSSGTVVAFPAQLRGTGIDAIGEVRRAGVIVNQPGGDRTYILAFNIAAAHADLSIDVYDEAGAILATEAVQVDPHGVVFHELVTPVTAGSVRLRGGYSVGPTAAGDVYAWVVVGVADGTVAPRVIVPQPVQSATPPTCCIP